jgi:predicted nucleic acid-binding protein
VISYLDTSLLVKLYIKEADSSAALRLLVRDDVEPVISWLSEVEMAAALEARSIRTGMGSNDPQLRIAYDKFRLERMSGIYRLVPLDSATFDLARSLAERYGRKLGVRALDVLHVAAALQSGAVAFGTFDGRQGRLAEAVGLKLLS